MTSNKRFVILITVVAVVCLAVVGATIAFYQSQTDERANTFRLGEVDVSVPETFPSIPPGANNATKVVQLENTGTVDAYLRAMIVPTFRGDDGSRACDVDYSTVDSGYILVTAPDGVKTYRLNLLPDWKTNWHFSPADNTFCYRHIVQPGKTTTLLLESVTKESGGDWKDLNIDILADAMQTQGDKAVEWLKTVWGVTQIGPTGQLSWD